MRSRRRRAAPTARPSTAWRRRTSPASARDAKGRAQPLEVTLVSGPAGRTYALLHVGRDAAAIERARGGLREATASFRPLSAADRGRGQADGRSACSRCRRAALPNLRAARRWGRLRSVNCGFSMGCTLAALLPPGAR